MSGYPLIDGKGLVVEYLDSLGCGSKRSRFNEKFRVFSRRLNDYDYCSFCLFAQLVLQPCFEFVEEIPNGVALHQYVDTFSAEVLAQALETAKRQINLFLIEVDNARLAYLESFQWDEDVDIQVEDGKVYFGVSDEQTREMDRLGQ